MTRDSPLSQERSSRHRVSEKLAPCLGCFPGLGRALEGIGTVGCSELKTILLE